MRVALLDHDPQHRKTLESLIKTTGHAFMGFGRPEALRAQLTTGETDILLLHWPGDTDGLPLLISLREQWPEVPTLLICSRAPGDAVRAELARGPSDVLLAPLRRQELLLRLQLLLARYRPERSRSEVITFGAHEFLLDRSQALVAGRSVPLTQKEFELALLLFRHLGRPLSRAYIHETVWSSDAELSSRTLDTHVSRVRNKLGLKPESGYRLSPVYGFGYRLEQIPE